MVTLIGCLQEVCYLYLREDRMKRTHQAKTEKRVSSSRKSNDAFFKRNFGEQGANNAIGNIDKKINY